MDLTAVVEAFGLFHLLKLRAPAETRFAVACGFLATALVSAAAAGAAAADTSTPPPSKCGRDSKYLVRRIESTG